MGGFDIRRASVSLGNMPRGAASSLNVAGRFHAAEYDHPFLRAAEDMDRAHRKGMQAFDRMVALQSENQYNAMKAEYEKMNAGMIETIRQKSDAELADYNPEDYRKEMEKLQGELLKDKRFRAAHPAAKQAFGRLAMQMNTHGFAQVGGWKLGAIERINEASLRLSEATSEQDYLGNQTPENREKFRRTVEQRAVKTFAKDSEDYNRFVRARLQELDDKTLAQNIGNAKSEQELSDIEKLVSGDGKDLKGIEDKKRRGIFEKALQHRRGELKREATIAATEKYDAFEVELLKTPAPKSVRSAAEMSKFSAQMVNYNESLARQCRAFAAANPEMEKTLPGAYKKLLADANTYEERAQRIALAAEADEKRERANESKALDDAQKAQIKANEERLSTALCQAQAAKLAGRLPQDEANRLTAGIWDTYYSLAMNGGVGTGFMQTFLGRVQDELNDQEANAMRKFYAAFGYKPEITASGEIAATVRKAAKKDSVDYYAPLEMGGVRDYDDTEVSATELVRLGDEVLTSLRSLGAEINREGVVDEIIGRIKTAWIKENIDANIADIQEQIMRIQQDALLRHHSLAPVQDKKGR